MLLRSLIVAFVSCLTLSASASPVELKASEGTGFPATLGDRDFFTATAPASLDKARRRSACRDNIRKVICLVDPIPAGETLTQRTCLPGGEAYATHFEKLFDAYPPLLQKMFCSLRHLYIERKFFGTAYAGTLKNPQGQVDGAMMGIRQSVLDEKLDLKTWASWKEQLSFGGIMDSYTVTPDLPKIDAAPLPRSNNFLFFVVAHEFGHIFDFANGLNKLKNCPEHREGPNEPECELEPGTWGALGWKTERTPLANNDFPKREGLCFYTCEGHPLSKADVPEVYAGLAKTNFLSAYATTEPWDDFADSLAYVLLARNMNMIYRIDTAQGARYDSMAKLRSPLFRQKRDYLNAFLQRTDIVYP